MLVKRIELENFMKHRRLSVELPEGLCLIVGENGSGKSTILEAVKLALFGFRGGRFSRKADYATDGCKGFSVALEVETANGPFRVVRTLNKSQIITFEGQEETKNVDAVVRQILGGLTREIFQETIYAPQGRIAHLVECDPSERRAIFRRILGVEALERVDQALLKEITRVERGIPSDLEEIKARVKDLEEEIPGLEAQGDALAKEVKDLEKEIKGVRDSLYRLEKARDAEVELRTLRGSKEALEAKVKALEGLKKEVETLKKAHERFETLEKEKERVSSEREKVGQEKASLEARREALKEKAVQLKGYDFEAARRKLEEIEARKKELSQILDKVNAKRELYLLRIETLEKQKLPKCITCGQEVSPERVEKLLAKAKARLPELEKERDSLAGQIKALEEEEAPLREELTKMEGIRQEIEKAKAEGLKEKYRALKARYKDLSARLEALEREMKALKPKRDEYLEKKGGLEEAEKAKEELEKLSKRMQELEALASQWDPAQAEELAKRRDELEATLRSKDATLAGVKERLSLLEKELKEKQGVVLKAQRAEKQRAFLEDLREGFKEYTARKIEFILRELPGLVTNIMQTFGFPYAIRVTPDYEILVSRPDLSSEKPKDWLSGGERTALGLAFRIGLARLLNVGCELLILDEPTHNLDRPRQELLRKILRETVDSGLVRQLLLITHERDFEGVQDWILDMDRKEAKIAA